MLKSVRYRSDAKLILGIGLVLCALASCVYGILLVPSVKGIKFEWEYVAIIIGAALIFILLSVFFFCKASACARKERREQAMRDNLDCAVEPEPAGSVLEGAVMIRVPESIDCKKRERATLKLPEKVDWVKVKKVGKVVVPVAAVCVAVAAVSSNAKYRKQAKRRKQFFRWLG